MVMSIKKLGIATAFAFSGAFTDVTKAEGSANTTSTNNKSTQISQTSANKSRDLSHLLSKNHVTGPFTLKLQEAQAWAEAGKGVAVVFFKGNDAKDKTNEEVFSQFKVFLDGYKIPSKAFTLPRGKGKTLISFAAEDQTFALATLENYKPKLIDAAVTYASAETIRRKIRESSRGDNVKLTANEHPEPIP